MIDTTSPMTVADYLRQNLSRAFSLPDECVNWLMDLWEVTQTFDDLVDGDPVDREALDRLIWTSLIEIPCNPWFVHNRGIILPVLMTAIMKWQASDRAERDNSADERSFVWRAAYYDVVMAAVMLVHGAEQATKIAHHVMHLYGESFADYRKEQEQNNG